MAAAVAAAVAAVLARPFKTIGLVNALLVPLEKNYKEQQ
jgi:hypothetical protein